LLILNCGGTLNKQFDISIDNMKITQSNEVIETILQEIKIPYEIQGICFKSSLEINSEDKKNLLKAIKLSNEKVIIVVHGLTTISKTANFLFKKLKSTKTIILVGTNQPFEVDKIEASLHIGLSIGFANSLDSTKGIFICRNGEIIKYKS
jgi:L-asparaginase